MTWNGTKWVLNVNGVSTGNVKCNINFKSVLFLNLTSAPINISASSNEGKLNVSGGGLSSITEILNDMPIEITTTNKDTINNITVNSGTVNLILNSINIDCTNKADGINFLNILSNAVVNIEIVNDNYIEGNYTSTEGDAIRINRNALLNLEGSGKLRIRTGEQFSSRSIFSGNESELGTININSGTYIFVSNCGAYSFKSSLKVNQIYINGGSVELMARINSFYYNVDKILNPSATYTETIFSGICERS